MKFLALIVAAVLLIGGGVILLNRNKTENNDTNQTTGTESQTSTNTSPSTDTTTSSFQPTGTKIVGNYYQYTKADYEAAKTAGRPIFLFFYANWCPTCAKQEPVVKQLMGEIADETKLEDLVAFRVNFNDNETDKDEEALAKELGVTYQHTMFVFDEDGKQLNKWLSQTSKETLKAAFQAAVEA